MNLQLKSKILIIFFIFLFIPLSVNAEQKLKFANIDLIIQETNAGKAMLKRINKIDQANFDKLKSFEKELKIIENEIKTKENIISDQELEKEVNKLKVKISDFNTEKKSMVKMLKDTKNKELKIFFDKINPIIKNYMNNNSIEILFNSKNIFMGNKKSDLTEKLINEINNKI